MPKIVPTAGGEQRPRAEGRGDAPCNLGLQRGGSSWHTSQHSHTCLPLPASSHRHPSSLPPPPPHGGHPSCPWRVPAASTACSLTGDAAVDVGGAVKGVEDHHIVAPELLLNEDGVVLLLGHLQEGVVGLQWWGGVGRTEKDIPIGGPSSPRSPGSVVGQGQGSAGYRGACAGHMVRLLLPAPCPPLMLPARAPSDAAPPERLSLTSTAHWPLRLSTFLKTSLAMMSSFFWSSPCRAVSSRVRRKAATRASGEAKRRPPRCWGQRRPRLG